MAIQNKGQIEKIKVTYDYLHTIFRRNTKDHVDLELFFRYNDKLESKIFRVDSLGLDRLILDLQIEQHMLDGKTLEQAQKLVEGL